MIGGQDNTLQRLDNILVAGKGNLVKDVDESVIFGRGHDVSGSIINICKWNSY